MAQHKKNQTAWGIWVVGGFQIGVLSELHAHTN